MIVFDLHCACGIQFEGWFADHADYEAQAAAGLLTCPVCNGTDVHKVLSPVPYHTGVGKPAVAGDGGDSSNLNEAAAARMLLSSVQRFVRENFENVGTRLAAEALKIHYGLSEPRNIRGVASEEEERMLASEGIQVLKLPMPPEDDVQ